MTQVQQQVYDATASAATLLTQLDGRGALAVSFRAAAAMALDAYDEMAAQGAWPDDWREYAHIELLDATE